MIEDIAGEAPEHRKFPYETFGPFPFSEGDLSSPTSMNAFWNDLDVKHPGLRSAIGVYIFAVQATKRSTLKPWYVGKTDKGFEGRIRSHKKLFAKVLNKNGHAAFFLIARLNTSSTKYMGPRKLLPSNEILETMLIERCLETNSKLFNAKKINYVRGLTVPGFKGKTKGKPKNAAKHLGHMLSKTKHKEL